MFDKKSWQREYMSRWYENRKVRAIQYLGGACVLCGSTDKLEFDHIHAHTKLFTITENISRKWSLILSELDKCQLLCEICHTAKHSRVEKQLSHEAHNFGIEGANPSPATLP